MEPTPENIKAFQDSIIKVVENGELIEGTYRAGKFDEIEALHYIEHKTKLWVVFKKETKSYITGWKLRYRQYQDLILTGKVK
jgi:hypothetical protein